MKKHFIKLNPVKNKIKFYDHLCEKDIKDYII